MAERDQAGRFRRTGYVSCSVCESVPSLTPDPSHLVKTFLNQSNELDPETTLYAVFFGIK